MTITTAVPRTTIDVGVKLHSPSTELMKLVNIHANEGSMDAVGPAWTDFTTITDYIHEHLYDIIYEMHHTYDKLLIDNGQVQINCPPSEDTNSSNTSHSTLLLRTLSEKEATNGSGITAKREIKVYDCGPATGDDNHRSILIREDIVQASHDVNDTHPILTEQSITIRVPEKKF